MDLEFIQSLVDHAETKIVMVVLDGLGGLPRELGGETELETARTPNLDALAARSALGLSEPAGPGITVESGPGHLALFGYDPRKYRIGRGVLEAVGIDFALYPNDVAGRGNYCLLDEAGLVADRRAGRIPTEASRELSKLLTVHMEDVDIFVETIKEHRAAIVMRGPGLCAGVSGSDPQKNGREPLPIYALNLESEKTARLVNSFIERSRAILGSHPHSKLANMMLVRGFDSYPNLPPFPKVFGMRAAAIAVYPAYKGIARLVGMQVLKVDGTALADEFNALEKNWDAYDFFYLHVKDTDLAGEDGDFERKVAMIEELDVLIPRLMALGPDVVVFSGDHSTPAMLKAHSWHLVPTLLYGKYVCADGIPEFGETACRKGSLGVRPATDIMPLAMANAMRLAKFSS
jgi:2,3-bisphosphoglycerate-independent phosphoglycerate mutase